MKKTNIFDLMIIFIFIGFVFVGSLYALTKQKEKISKPTILKVVVNIPEQADLIYNEASKLGNVYLNSINIPVTAIRVEKISDTTTGKTKGLNIYLKSTGVIKNDQYIFNGQRVLIGQKAEIHGNYFAPGVVGEIKYAE